MSCRLSSTPRRLVPVARSVVREGEPLEAAHPATTRMRTQADGATSLAN